MLDKHCLHLIHVSVDTIMKIINVDKHVTQNIFNK